MPANDPADSPSLPVRLTHNPRHTWLLFVAFTVVYLFAIVAVVGLHRDAWHDEDHFSATVRQFGNSFSVDQCRDYDEVNPPLFFVMYAAWGRVFGFELAQLRLLSLFLSFVACLVLYKLVSHFTRNPFSALLAPLVMMLNPYYLGISIFIYPDLLALLCVLLFLVCLEREQMAGLFLASMLGLLSRQYFVFVTAAAMAMFAGRYLATREKRSAAMVAVLGASMIPLCLLFLAWHGMAPPAGNAHWNPESHLTFHTSYVTLYVICFAVYLLPVVILRGRLFVVPRRTAIVLAVASLLYWVMPVEVSEVAKPLYSTVGLFHRLLEVVLRNDALVHVVFFLCFAGGLFIVYFFCRDCLTRIGKNQFDAAFFLDAATLAFLAVMPFSYQVWEKYFLLVLPFAMLRLLMEQQVVRDGPDTP